MTSQASGLFKTAVAEGGLTKAASAIIDARDIGADINAALGVSIDDIKVTGELALFTALIDDSTSIRMRAGNTEAIREGTNLCLDALSESKAEKDGVLAMLTMLNRGLLTPFVPVGSAPRLTVQNYDPNGYTPLYDRSIVTCGAVIAKHQESLDGGVPCRTITAFITDGHDEGSQHTARDVKVVIDSMLATESHIVALMGIDDGRTDFRGIAREMGIPDNWVLTPKNSPSEIRRAFGTLSKSAVRVSQARGGSFSQTAAGGFGSP